MWTFARQLTRHKQEAVDRTRTVSLFRGRLGDDRRQ
jgi:hypothetical protein